MNEDETTEGAEEPTSDDAEGASTGSEEPTSDDAFVDPAEVEDWEEEDEDEEPNSDSDDTEDQDETEEEGSDEDSDDEEESTEEAEEEPEVEEEEEEEEESEELKALLKDKNTVDALKKLKIDPKKATLPQIIQALSKSYWESGNSASKTVRTLRAEIEKLQDELDLAKPPAKPEGEEEKVDPKSESPEVQKINSKIKFLEDSKKSIGNKRTELKKQSIQTQKAVVIAEHNLENATEENRASLTEAWKAAVRAHNALADQDEALLDRLQGPDGLNEKLEGLQEKLSQAKQAVEDRKAQEEQTRRELHQKKKVWRNTFESTVKEASKGFKVEEENREAFYEAVKAGVTYRLRELALENPNRPPVDITKLTQFVAGRYAKAFRLTAAEEFKKESGKKLKTVKAIKTAPKNGSGSSSPKAKPSQKQKTWEDAAANARAHAAKILGGE